MSDKPCAWSISIFGSISLLLFALAAWFAWRKLILSEYRKINEQAEFISHLRSEEEK
jgi:hypothetical protein